MLKRLAIILSVLSLLNGCSMFGGSDNSEPPAPLVQFEPSIHVAADWFEDTGKGTGKYFLRLNPYTENDRIYIVDDEGRVSAYSLEKGKRLWKKKYKLPVTGGLNGGEGILVFGTASGEVVAVSQEDGKELWRTPVSSEVMSVAPVALDVVVVRTNDGKVYGLNSDSGSLRWQAGRKTPALSLRGKSVPLITHGAAIVGFDNGQLAAISLTQGSVIWETAVAIPRGRSELDRMVDIDGLFVEWEGVIYVATYQGRLAAVNLQNGRVIWSRDMSSFTGLAVDGGNLYLTDEFSNVWAIDRNSGATLWKQPALRMRMITAPAIIDRYVVVADYEGYLHWMDKYEGSFVARVQSDDEGVLATPLVRDEHVIMLGKTGELTSWKVWK
jgi:outer membrane protein assembly factor BamB